MRYPAILRLSVAVCLAISSVMASAVNNKPFVVPELKQWNGADGTFSLTDETRITYNDDTLQPVADCFSDDYNTMFGRDIPVVKGKGKKGDIVLSLKKNDSLGTEGYTIDITDRIAISAPDVTGISWATKTLLQMREASPEFPKGKITDSPDYGWRGFMIDCGRKYIPLDYLYRLVDIMAYYKMNVLHVHLNDNGFKYYFDDDWDKTQAAFRLESSTYPGLTSRDGSYSKDEFRDFQKYAISRGVEIIPEIDFPAHALAFTRYMPEIGSVDGEYGRDHLDLTKEETYTFLDNLLKEYLEGDDPVFVGPRFHIGTDEYSNRDSAIVEKFRYLTDRYIRYTEDFGKRPCVWGALTHAKGNQPVKSDGVDMYVWYNGYADPNEMLRQGYDIISIPDGLVYIVPAAGYYYDYLNSRHLYDNWTPAVIGNVTIEERHPQLKGGMFAVWNDHPGNGITVKDIHHRIMAALPVMATKTWRSSKHDLSYDDFAKASAKLSEAPGVNYLGRHGDKPGIVYQTDCVVPGSTSPIEEIGYNYSVEFDIEGAEGDDKGTILFSSPAATVWLSDPITGTLAFSREDKLYHFRHDIRPGEKSHILITGDNRGTRLHVNGRLVDDLNQRSISYNDGKNKMAEVRTLVFPLAKAGDFKSKVTNLKVYNYIVDKK